MTIQDAIERSKRLHRERGREANTGAHPGAVRTPDAESAKVALPDAVTRSEPGETFPELAKVTLDAQSCVRSGVLVTQQQLDRNGRAAAAYRMLRGRISHRFQSGNWSCVGITSPGAGEGKSITALNLALNIAREKRRTVYLLDLDMRSPSVFKYVGVRPPRQVSEYLAGNLNAADVLFSTDVENLVLAGNLEPAEGPSELLASKRLDEILRHIRRRSPSALIIADLPPVLSTDEALVVAPRLDAMLLVVSEGKTKRDMLQSSANLLSDFNVAGVILNRSSELEAEDYYAYGAATS
jgi:protein-tyrosine kinase